jgi:hypothetical protein
MHPAIRRLLVGVLFLPLVALVVACGGGNPADSRWATAQQESRNKPAVAKEALAGKEFNKFFPKAESPWDLTYKQEKQGTAIASLKKDGKEVATLTVFDTVSNPDAAKEYKESDKALAGCPLVAKGKMGTAVLVANRFQVTVRSAPNSSFTEDDRKEWIKKFDLEGIAKLND